jgi:tight adherence protein C
MALVAVVLLTAAAGAARIQIDLRALPVLATIAVVSGFLARDWYLSKQGRRRTERLIEELPTAIDLLTLSIMSGESVPAACERVGRTLGPGIGAEFTATVADMRAGAATAPALEGLARRIPDPATARLIDSLIVAIERGAPLGDVLRAQADDCREARRRSLLELGGRREVLMLVPVVFLIMPVVVVFALMPGLVALDLLVP